MIVKEWLAGPREGEFFYYEDSVPLGSIRKFGDRYRVHVIHPFYFSYKPSLQEAKATIELFVDDCRETPKKKIYRNVLTLTGAYAILIWAIHRILN